MSRENVDSFKRAVDAANRGDLAGFFQDLDPELEWYPLYPGLLGEEALYRGYEGVRELNREATELWVEFHYEFSEFRELGDRVVAIGTLRARGRQSTVEIESPIGYVVDFKDGKMIRARGYGDPEQALEAAGLRE
jgi:ketosteroid isomerase-like protein